MPAAGKGSKSKASVLLLRRAGGATRESVDPRRCWLWGLQMEQARGQDIPLYLISLPRTEKDVCSKASVPSLQSLTAFVSAEHTILFVGCLPSLQTLNATHKRRIKSRHQIGIRRDGGECQQPGSVVQA